MLLVPAPIGPRRPPPGRGSDTALGCGCSAGVALAESQGRRADGPRPAGALEEVTLLGTLPDEGVAAKTGRTPGAVSLMRRRLGIANPRDRRGRRFSLTGGRPGTIAHEPGRGREGQLTGRKDAAKPVAAACSSRRSLGQRRRRGASAGPTSRRPCGALGRHPRARGTAQGALKPSDSRRDAGRPTFRKKNRPTLSHLSEKRRW
jgi:hypothetical protein